MQSQNHRSLNPPLLPLVSIVSLIYFIYYLWWRAAFTLNPQHPFFSWLLWGAEAFGVISYLLFIVFTHDIDPRVDFFPPPEGLQVDIFVPTYNEDSDILEATLIGCQRVSYPHITWVLDDGNRPVIKALADKLGCRYIARPEHDHAKAGNINYALKQTSGDFIVVLDADMVPQPDYLERTLGYFQDEKLALIQLPQEFYNQDSIQHARQGVNWHEQSLFFRVIQPGKNAFNSAFWCGSPSVVRRKALDQVGGVATATITEDIHTNVLIHSKGSKSLFVNEPLAYGIAPQTIKAFLLQRLRWAQGTMQLYRSKDSPVWIKGLTLMQRLAYLSSFLAYFEAFQKFVLLTIPILIIGFNIFPMRVGVLDFVLHWTPYFILNIIANQVGGRGVFQYFKTEKYNLLKTIIFIQSSVILFSRKPLKFKVTPKSVDDSVYRQERTSLLWYMGIFGTLVGGMLYAIYKVVAPGSYNITWDAFVIAFVWSGYNSYVIYLALKEVFERRHERKQYRFLVDDPGTLRMGGSEIPCTVLDLSHRGAGITVDRPIATDVTPISLRVCPPDFQSMDLPVSEIITSRLQPNGRQQLGVLLSGDLGKVRSKLIEYLFIHQPRKAEESVYRLLQWDPMNWIRLHITKK